jgi:pimeloyl-ACP methyl ester carboxylesterase
MEVAKSVPLYSEFLGGEGKPPMVILHGLLGSTRNWHTAGKALTKDFAVYLLDLRNHGSSPWSDDMNFDVLVADLKAWLDTSGLRDIVLMGHSLGGKTVMTYACRYPERVKNLVVIDIAPKKNYSRWKNEFELMEQLDTENMKSRKDAEDYLEMNGVAGWAFRKFLVSNLVRKDEGGFCWRTNIPVLGRNLPNMFAKNLTEGERFDGPVLVIRGERSNFVTDDDRSRFEEHFDDFTMETVSDAGHNVHVDHMDGFMKSLYGWLESH